VLSAAPARSDDREPVVAKLRFEGVEAFETRALEDHLLTAAPSWKPWVPDPSFDEQTLREDLDRVVGLYREWGYYEAQAEYELDWNRGRSKVRILIRVHEGEPVRVAERSILLPAGPWLASPQRDALLADLPLAEGAIFGAAPYRKAKDELVRRLANLARPEASLEGGAEVDLEQRSARVRWAVDPGPEVHFGPVSVEGLVDVDAELVLRELALDEGDLFSAAALDAGQRSIYGLGLFRSVTVQGKRPGPEAEAPEGRRDWPVVVRVEERPPRTVRIAVGYGTEDSFRARVGWTHRNFYGAARTLELTAKYSSLVAGLESRLTQPRFLDPLLRLETEASLLHETEPSFTANRLGAGLMLQRPLRGPWTGRVGYRLEFADIVDLDADDPSGEESSRLSTLLLGLERSTVDDPLQPRAGTRIDLRVEPTLAALGSDRSFVTLAAEGRAFFPLGPAVLALRLRLGAVQPVAGSERGDVPIFKRLFSGGSTSVRGFDYQKLGPLDDYGDPLGGLTRTEGSVELRFPLWRWIGGVAFFDVGQVDPAPFAFDADDVYYSVGPGIRVNTPVGPLGFDFGYALRRPAGEDRWRLHFSVGTAF
jgi:outer membrane protein assembly complex protein YaeT